MVDFVKFVILFAIANFGTAFTQEPVTLKFVRGVPRLNTEEYIDYYFYCQIKGIFLHWQYEDEPLTAFRPNDVGHSLVNVRSNYEYTATLLSSRPADNNNRYMDSIVVVTSRSDASFNVTCTNDFVSETEPSQHPKSALSSARTNNSDIVLNYISSANIVRNISTHIFVCGVQHSTQILSVDGLSIAFTEGDHVGVHRAGSSSIDTVDVQGIVIARTPFTIISMLIVARNSDVNVTCFYDTQQRTTLASNMHKAMTEDTPTDDVETEPLVSEGTLPDLSTSATSSSSMNEGIRKCYKH